jgi:hypothetical protein
MITKTFHKRLYLLCGRWLWLITSTLKILLIEVKLLEVLQNGVKLLTSTLKHGKLLNLKSKSRGNFRKN